MEIIGKKTPFIPDGLQPLFEAMKAGKRIKSVTCMSGAMNADNPAADFQIENFVAVDYWSGMGTNSNGDQFDYVDTDAPEDRENRKSLTKSFYMSWVRTFEL